MSSEAINEIKTVNYKDLECFKLKHIKMIRIENFDLSGIIKGFCDLYFVIFNKQGQVLNHQVTSFIQS